MQKRRANNYGVLALAGALVIPASGYGQSTLYRGEDISASSTATAHACSGGFVVEKTQPSDYAKRGGFLRYD